ncbi:MAG TPA: hypothetical protein VFY39_07545 [Gammaproteobacteria bacterium]|nr:hypothetical protein [Gammaproteobacteria bacterium]
MRTHKRLGFWGLILLSIVATAAQAQDWSVIINGKAIHVNASKDWNEANWGLGVEREFVDGSHWVKLAVANGFVDSANAMSYMAGGGLMRRFRLPALGPSLHVDVGVVGFLMTRHDVDDNRPFPGALPALTIGTRKVALNLTYLPGSVMEAATQVSRQDPTVSGVFFLQLKLDPSLLGFGGRQHRAASYRTASCGSESIDAPRWGCL